MTPRIIGSAGMTAELKNYYSKHILARLVPASLKGPVTARQAFRDVIQEVEAESQYEEYLSENKYVSIF